MKTGILIHPFWSNVGEIEELYYNLEYDKVIVYLPILNKNNRDVFYKTHKDLLIDLMFLSVNKKDLDKHKWLINSVLNITDKTKYLVIKTLSNIRNTLSKVYGYKVSLKELKNFIRDLDLDFIKKISPVLYYNSIYGDMCNFKRIHKSLKKLKKNLIGKDVVFKYYGGVSFIEYKENNHNLFNKESEYFIFGEYYNKCVKDVKYILTEKFDIDIKPIKKYSIYGAFDSSLELSKRKQKNYHTYIDHKFTHFVKY